MYLFACSKNYWLKLVSVVNGHLSNFVFFQISDDIEITGTGTGGINFKEKTGIVKVSLRRQKLCA